MGKNQSIWEWLGIMSINKHECIVEELTRKLQQANEQVASLKKQKEAQEKMYLALAEKYEKVQQKRDSRGRYTKRKH